MHLREQQLAQQQQQLQQQQADMQQREQQVAQQQHQLQQQQADMQQREQQVAQQQHQLQQQQADMQQREQQVAQQQHQLQQQQADMQQREQQVAQQQHQLQQQQADMQQREQQVAQQQHQLQLKQQLYRLQQQLDAHSGAELQRQGQQQLAAQQHMLQQQQADLRLKQQAVSTNHPLLDHSTCSPQVPGSLRSSIFKRPRQDITLVPMPRYAVPMHALPSIHHHTFHNPHHTTSLVVPEDPQPPDDSDSDSESDSDTNSDGGDAEVHVVLAEHIANADAQDLAGVLDAGVLDEGGLEKLRQCAACKDRKVGVKAEREGVQLQYRQFKKLDNGQGVELATVQTTLDGDVRPQETAMFNAGFNAVSGHTFAICPFEAHCMSCSGVRAVSLVALQRF
ncbi:hypothetical protein QJQ45_013305 [Haematococcus lacustris]|nr:hypothetical protein QJQ45_013305 [Haematococcus lacustris]